MADGINPYSASQISDNYNKYSYMFAKEANDSLGQSDFLRLLTEQLKNQDFNNAMDNTEFIAQMAQFSQLQAIQQMTYYSRASYATSLIGKTVAVAGFDNRGNYSSDKGLITSVRMQDEDFIFTVNGNEYTSSNIMEILVPENEPAENPDSGETDEAEGTENSGADEEAGGTEGGSDVTLVPDGNGGWVEKEPDIDDLLDGLI